MKIMFKVAFRTEKGRALGKLQMVKSFFDYICGLHIPSGLFISVVFGSLIYF